MMILLIFCAIVIVVCGFVYAQSEANKQKIINLSLDEIDAMEGHQFEHYTAAMLQFDGFEQVQVTQASGDYGVDVVAYKGGHKWAFQCKRYSKNLGLKPIQEVYAGAKRYGADKAVVFTNVYFTPNAQSLANTLHVELWGRDKLADMIWQRKQEEEAKKEFKESVKQGTLKIQIGEGDDFDDKWQNMGYNVKGFAETYSGLTLPKGWFFAIDGDLKCEITKSKMLEIE